MSATEKSYKYDLEAYISFFQALQRSCGHITFLADSNKAEKFPKVSFQLIWNY